MGYIKKRWQDMDRGRRIVLLIQPAMFLLFLLLFLMFGRQQVVSWMDFTLRYEQQGETAVYSGPSVQFTVTPGVVEFRRSGMLRGTYTIAEDPTALPERADLDMDVYNWEDYTGVEIKKDGEVWFRGACHPDSFPGLFREDGTYQLFGVIVSIPSPDPEPDPGDILRFAYGPKTSPRGEVLCLLLGLFLNMTCAAALLFEDQLFRWQLSFRVRYPDDAEPSDWELFSRWAGWIVLTVAALFVYIPGLTGLS